MAPTPKLQDQLDAKKAEWAASADDHMKAVYTKGIEAIRDTGVLATMKKVGDAAPTFSLPDATGGTVSSADLLKQGPVVVVFYRGAWCPYCNLELHAWQQHLDAVHALGAELVAISPQTPDASLTSKQKNELAFPVLSDVGNHTADAFGITSQVIPEVVKVWKGKIVLSDYNGDDSAKLPLPATYLIDRDGRIRYAFADAEYRVRAEPDEVLEELRKL